MNSFRLPFYSIVFAAVVALTALPVQGQATFGRVEEMRTNATMYYYHVIPATATIQVYVMGTVRAPGLYEVSEGMSLGQILALAGGPPSSPRPSYRSVETITRLYRSTSTGQELIFERPLEEAISNQTAQPRLEFGDVVTMEVIERDRFNWRDVTRIVSAGGILALAIERMARTF